MMLRAGVCGASEVPPELLLLSRPCTPAPGWPFLPMHRAANWEKMERYVLRALSASSGQDSPAPVVPREHQGHGAAFSQPARPSAPAEHRSAPCLFLVPSAHVSCRIRASVRASLRKRPQPFPAPAFAITPMRLSCRCSALSGSSSSGGCSSPPFLNSSQTHCLVQIFKMLIRLFILSSAKL